MAYLGRMSIAEAEALERKPAKVIVMPKPKTTRGRRARKTCVLLIFAARKDGL
jgi:hypothetical protein